jgi:3-oxoacyl-[acyl-carrier protein] reductase
MQEEVMRAPEMENTKDYLAAENSLIAKNLVGTRFLELCDFLVSNRSQGITGKLISADWDNWTDWPNHLTELETSDLYTLGRITSRDRGQEWGDL